MRHLATSAALLLGAASLAAQSTWIVDIDNRAGANFLDLASALVVAQPGDTLLVRASGFGQAYSGFTTAKGVTIVSDGALFSTEFARVEVVGLPAGETFRMAGFIGRRNLAFYVRLTNCQGIVQIEDLHAVEFGSFFPTSPSMEVRNCSLVTMVDCENFGTPALQVDNSHVVLTRCRFGVTSIGIGGGPALRGTGSTVDVVEPAFNAALVDPAIELTDSTLRLSGTAASFVQGGVDRATNVAAPAVVMTRGTARIDPLVQLNPFWTGRATGGTGAFSFAVTPAVLVEGDRPNQSMTVRHIAAVGDTIVGLLGLPALPTPTVFGDVLLRTNPLVTTVTTTLSQRVVVQTIPVPASLPVGVGLAVQDAVLNASGLTLGIACQFVVH